MGGWVRWLSIPVRRRGRHIWFVFCEGQVEDMFFGPGKRKGYSSFKVVDRSNKSLKSTVNLPSALPPEQENTVQEQEESSYSDWGPDDASEDQEDEACSSQYKTRKERLSKNWEALRATLLKSSLQLEGFVPQEWVECHCSEAVESRCRDCSFTAFYCLDCCNRLHQTKHHFHQPEIKRVWFTFIKYKK